jgi:hypothetical protein
MACPYVYAVNESAAAKKGEILPMAKKQQQLLTLARIRYETFFPDTSMRALLVEPTQQLQKSG